MDRLDWLALLLAAAAVILQVFVPPSVGLANNGDFPKITGPFDMGNPADARDVFRFADTRYVVDPSFHWESRFYSSELFLFAAALALNSVSLNPDIFDVRVVGAVHAAVFLWTLYLLLPLLRPFRPVVRGAVLLLAVFFFTDVMYVSFFNSFYMDTAAFLFLWLCVVAFLRALRWRRPADRWLFVISAACLVTSKTQHYPLGIPIALLVAWKGGLLTPGRSWWFRAVSVTSLLAATAFSAQRSTPSEFPALAAYNVVFFQILPTSKNVSGDLKDLGLDESYRRFIGTHAYAKDSGMRDLQFLEDFRQKHMYGRIARFFLTHPAQALEMAVSRMGYGGRLRPRMGNFDRRTGFPDVTISHTFAVWSGFKAFLFTEHGVRYLIYGLSLSLFVTTIAFVRRESLPAGVPIAVAALVAMTLLEMSVASLADALDPERHFSLFGALTDVLLVCAGCLAAVPARRAIETITTTR